MVAKGLLDQIMIPVGFESHHSLSRFGAAMKMRTRIAYSSILLLLSCSIWGEKFQLAGEPSPALQPQVLVLGFMGGRNKQDDPNFGVGRFAQRLREMDLPCIRVATIENDKRAQALELVRGVFDQNADGKIDAEEHAATRLVVYGQSFGGAAVVKFARQLQAEGIPIMLTIQIDAVGLNDSTIPANVAAAANLFQANGSLIHGPKEIRAEDPKVTRIIGSFQFDYRGSNIDISDLPVHKRLFQESHVRMDRDPAVWDKVEELILVALAENGWCAS
jgi:hypothetical protein